MKPDSSQVPLSTLGWLSICAVIFIVGGFVGASTSTLRVLQSAGIFGGSQHEPYPEVLDYEGTGVATLRVSAKVDPRKFQEVWSEVRRSRYKLQVTTDHTFRLTGSYQTPEETQELRGRWIYSSPNLVLSKDEDVFRKLEVAGTIVRDLEWADSGIVVEYELR